MEKTAGTWSKAEVINVRPTGPAPRRGWRSQVWACDCTGMQSRLYIMTCLPGHTYGTEATGPTWLIRNFQGNLRLVSLFRSLEWRRCKHWGDAGRYLPPRVEQQRKASCRERREKQMCRERRSQVAMRRPPGSHRLSGSSF